MNGTTTVVVLVTHSRRRLLWNTIQIHHFQSLSVHNAETHYCHPLSQVSSCPTPLCLGIVQYTPGITSVLHCTSWLSGLGLRLVSHTFSCLARYHRCFSLKASVDGGGARRYLVTIWTSGACSGGCNVTQRSDGNIWCRRETALVFFSICICSVWHVSCP